MATRGTEKGLARFSRTSREMTSCVVEVPISMPTDKSCSLIRHLRRRGPAGPVRLRRPGGGGAPPAMPAGETLPRHAIPAPSGRLHVQHRDAPGVCGGTKVRPGRPRPARPCLPGAAPPPRRRRSAGSGSFRAARSRLSAAASARGFWARPQRPASPGIPPGGFGVRRVELDDVRQQQRIEPPMGHVVAPAQAVRQTVAKAQPRRR